MTANEIYAAILEEVRKVVPDSRTNTIGTGCHFIVNGEEIRVDARERMEGTWHVTRTGKWQVNVDQGNYRTKMFPPRKAGFDYAAIAACIIEAVSTKRANREAEDELDRQRDAFNATPHATIIRWLMGLPRNASVWKHRAIADRLKRLPEATFDNLRHFAELEGPKI